MAGGSGLGMCGARVIFALAQGSQGSDIGADLSRGLGLRAGVAETRRRNPEMWRGLEVLCRGRKAVGIWNRGEEEGWRCGGEGCLATEELTVWVEGGSNRKILFRREPVAMTVWAGGILDD